MPKHTLRVFDVDFQEVEQTIIRNAPLAAPNAVVYNTAAQMQMILEDEQGGALFYEAIDLSQLTLEGRSFQPLQIAINRPYTVPRGTKLNTNISVQNEEYFFVWYSNVAYPLQNMTALHNATFIQALRRVGMNTSPHVALETDYEEEQPNLGQLLWASSAAFLPSLDTALTVANGLLPALTSPVAPVDIAMFTNTMRQVDSSEWGSMDIVQGPMLHFFRLITNYSQNMNGVPAQSPLVQTNGWENQTWSPINLKVICQEVDLSDEEYLTTAYQTLQRNMPGGPN